MNHMFLHKNVKEQARKTKNILKLKLFINKILFKTIKRSKKIDFVTYFLFS